MTKETLAAQLNGREYPIRLTMESLVHISQSKLVIIHGASDDLMEFSGAIDDERGAPDVAFINPATKTLMEVHDDASCECNYCGYKEAVKSARKIEALWCEVKGICWTFRTDIPHASFDIMEDGAVFCRGIVFSTDEL